MVGRVALHVALLLTLAFRVGDCRPASETHANALIAYASLSASPQAEAKALAEVQLAATSAKAAREAAAAKTRAATEAVRTAAAAAEEAMLANARAEDDVRLLQASALASLNASASGRHRGPRPMILLSKGRGGSTVVAEVISRFAHTDPTMIRKEILGHGREDMRHPSDPKATMVDWFAKKTAQHPRSDLIGFKWKPWHIGSKAYAGAWDWVVAHDVRVLWMTRNALDELISSTKHMDAQRLLADSLTPHCKTKDSGCIAEHQQTRVTLAPGTLVEMLTNDTRMFYTDVKALLVKRGVRYHHVTFEELFESSTERARYHRDTAARDLAESTTSLREHRRFDHASALVAWNRAFSFLGLDEVDTYSKIIQTADSFSARTAPQTQCESLENPEEVRAALKGTAFEALLTC